MNSAVTAIPINLTPQATPAKRGLLINTGLSLATCLAGAIGLSVQGIQLEWSSLIPALGLSALLTPIAVVFQRRGLAEFANLLAGFVCMVLFATGLSMLTYAAAATGAPLADPVLMAGDAVLRVDLAAVVHWAGEHPVLCGLVNSTYPAVFPMTMVALVALGFDRQRDRLQQFVFVFIMGGLLTTALFTVFPAAGPFAAYQYEPRPDQVRFLEHFTALRSGTFERLSLQQVEGLITFPSFHTAWALLLIWSVRHYRWLFRPYVALNSLVVLSTMLTGWHYATDVLGGAAITIASIVLCRATIGDPDAFPGTDSIESAVEAVTIPFRRTS